MTQVQVTFRGMTPTPMLQEAANKALHELLASGGSWTRCHLTFEKPAAFALGDELWLHLDVESPERQVSITRTRPAGTDTVREATDEFVRRAFLGVSTRSAAARTLHA